MKMETGIDRWNIPIYKALMEYGRSMPVPFHMPGHKLGRGIPKEFLNNMAALDLTEIPGTDNLYRPSGIIKEAQELAAAAFGADRSYFLVNGATCGIYSIISTLCKFGDSLIVSRDCHKSVITGMMLAGVNPVYVMPELDISFGLAAGVLSENIQKALADNPRAAGVLLTSPNYYGVCSDIRKIARIVHSFGKFLAVDEAHGSHLKFNSRLPLCAMEAGADICVQSAHKTLPALTQGAYLHVKSRNIDLDRLEYYMGIYQTSSPSYIIMAFLDIAREIMQRNGSSLLESLLDITYQKKEEFQDKLHMLDKTVNEEFQLDPTRMVFNFRHMGITGFRAESILREACNIQVEMSDLYNIVCIATVSDNEDSLGKLFSGISQLSQTYGNSNAEELIYMDFRIPPQAMGFKEAIEAKGQRMALSDSAGKICRELIAPYPPGIPLVCPGEMLTEEAVRLLTSIISSGGMIQGVDPNGCVNVVR